MRILEGSYFSKLLKFVSRTKVSSGKLQLCSGYAKIALIVVLEEC